MRSSSDTFTRNIFSKYKLSCRFKIGVMKDNNLNVFLGDVLQSIPNDWLRLTTHRLDIYNESLAKTQFLEQFEGLYKLGTVSEEQLTKLPTAFDYIRLGHPLSCVLEWFIAKGLDLNADHVISFDSLTIPVMAVLRKNLFEKKSTRIVYEKELPSAFDADSLKKVYAYQFDLCKVDSFDSLPAFEGTTILMLNGIDLSSIYSEKVDFTISADEKLGSVLVASPEMASYLSEVQHVRRRETISMTPANCFDLMNSIVGKESSSKVSDKETNKSKVSHLVKGITGANSKSVAASSGLSMQYAIVMGLIDHALKNHSGKNIKIVVPPNCYGGTNDQARRVAACIDNVEVMDLPVDGDHDMVQSVDLVLSQIAEMDAVPFIIAEIPTNPRVEVPNLQDLRDALSKERTTKSGSKAIEPVFILDQTFCPNVYFLREEDTLASVQTIAYVSGSKFPSGGKCTAGYSIANSRAAHLMDKVEKHLLLCDNEATDLQFDILAEQLPSMVQRIADAYKNTREFVNFIEEKLPTAKINFVSEELAELGFTPSVFSLDLPSKGDTPEEKEENKRMLNDKLITMMIKEIPNESKYCVSYGQLKGCYWTIPATSTQGTTKESDKDYIARVALSGDMDLDKHKQVFASFVDEI